jgi:hypothetical protein
VPLPLSLFPCRQRRARARDLAASGLSPLISATQGCRGQPFSLTLPMSFWRRNSLAGQAKGSSLEAPSRRPCCCGGWRTSRWGRISVSVGVARAEPRSGEGAGARGRGTRFSCPLTRKPSAHSHQLGRDQRRQRDALLRRHLAGLGAGDHHHRIPRRDLLDHAAQPARHFVAGWWRSLAREAWGATRRLKGGCFLVRGPGLSSDDDDDGCCVVLLCVTSRRSASVCRTCGYERE